MKYDKPVLFYMIGYPGAGKTTLAKKLAKSLDSIHLYGDKIAFELFTLPRYTSQEAQVLYNFMDYQAKELLNSGKSVIYDVSANTELLRSRLMALANSCEVPSFGLWVNTPLDLALRRCSQLRSSEYQANILRIVTPDVFHRMVSNFEAINHRKETILAVSGTDPFSAQLNTIEKGLSQVLPKNNIKRSSLAYN